MLNYWTVIIYHSLGIIKKEMKNNYISKLEIVKIKKGKNKNKECT